MITIISVNSEVQSNRFVLEYEYIKSHREMVQNRSNLIAWIRKKHTEYTEMQAVDYFEKATNEEEDYINDFFLRFLKDYHKDRTRI